MAELSIDLPQGTRSFSMSLTPTEANAVKDWMILVPREIQDMAPDAVGLIYNAMQTIGREL